jgi:hypothetical protein
LALKYKRRAVVQRDFFTATDVPAAVETYRCLALSGFLTNFGLVSPQKPNLIFEGAKLQFIFFQTRDLMFFLQTPAKIIINLAFPLTEW